MDIQNYLKRIKLTFWHYQLVGWLIFLTNEILREYQFWAISGFTKLYLIITWFILFLETLILRYVYRLFYKLKKTPLFYLIMISIFSVVCSFFWHVVRLLYINFLLNDEIVSHQASLFYRVLLSAWVPFTWSILYFGIKYWNDLQDELERSRASLLLASKAQLQMLRYQINPHFLFNSLNSIQGLMYQDLKKADLMLTELSEFLRYTLKFNTDIYVSLKDEFEIIEKYLFVEKIRFDDRLDYSIQLPSSLRKEKILCFLTQPFVENALKHGMKSSPYSKIEIVIEASVDGRNLVITVTNTGKWKENERDDTTGIKNVKERLDNAYPGNYSLNISDDRGIVKVEIKVPRNE